MERSAHDLAGLSAVIVSAAAVITTIFGLFNSVLKDLMPQVQGAAQAVNVVAFGTLVLLLVLVLVIRARLPKTSQYLWAGVGAVCLVAAMFVYLSFSDLVRARVYQYPPASAPGTEQRPFVSAPYHELGRKRAEGMDVATAVSQFGGPALVNGRQVLWTEEALAQVVGQFVRYYMALAFLMTTALFVVAIALWRSMNAGTRRKPAAPKPQA
ncbi:MAG TPA: hypothetical protein VFL64_02985 [Rhizobacter sp.]|nr:hypothetical protein [Rhizobacter sp.]